MGSPASSTPCPSMSNDAAAMFRSDTGNASFAASPSVSGGLSDSGRRNEYEALSGRVMSATAASEKTKGQYKICTPIARLICATMYFTRQRWARRQRICQRNIKQRWQPTPHNTWRVGYLLTAGDHAFTRSSLVDAAVRHPIGYNLASMFS